MSLTIVDGKVVHGTGDCASLPPTLPDWSPVRIFSHCHEDSDNGLPVVERVEVGVCSCDAACGVPAHAAPIAGEQPVPADDARSFGALLAAAAGLGAPVLAPNAAATFAARYRTVRHACSALAVLAAASVSAQVAVSATADAIAPRPKLESLRYDEDWRGMCDLAARTQWLDALKCITLAPRTTLTFGGELRERIEVSGNPFFGIQHSSDDAFLHRIMAHADLHFDDSVRASSSSAACCKMAGSGDRVRPTSTDSTYCRVLSTFRRLWAMGGRRSVAVGKSSRSARNGLSRFATVLMSAEPSTESKASGPDLGTALTLFMFDR